MHTPLRQSPRFDAASVAPLQVISGKMNLLSTFWRDQNAGDARFTDDVLVRVRAQVRYALMRHVVNVAHVILKARHAPPETEGVGECRSLLLSKRRRNRTMRLCCLEICWIEVPRCVDLLVRRVERIKCRSQLFVLCLAADGDRASVVQCVV